MHSNHLSFRMSWLVGAVMLIPAANTIAQAPAGQAQSPFDKDDPEIQMIRQLNWKTVDFSKLDARTRCLSLLALNKGLASIGAKADARLDLLISYIDDNSLGEALAKSKEAIPEPNVVTFEDMQKVGAAYAQSPAGKAKLAGDLTNVPDDALEPYIKLHERGARRSFEEALESRHQVRMMAIFLEKQGKLEDFKKWSAEEKKRRIVERQAEAEQKRADAAEAEQQRKEAAAAAAAERKRQEAELATKRMELAVQQQGSGQSTAPTYEDATWWVDDDDYWGYPYYYSYAYRGDVRDRLENAWDRWQGNQPTRPTPRGGRGGGRVGGRR